jgi:restriction system protein
MDSVQCSSCGALLDETRELQPDDRLPCPTCGSMARSFHVHISETVQATDSFSAIVTQGDVQAITAISDLLLQAVIVPGDKINSGRLIEAVAIPWFDIIDFLKKDPSAAYQIPPHKWEEIIAGSYRKAGFDEVILTPRSGDAGRDVIATIRGIGSVRVIDQVKAYKPGHLVTADDARALYGVLMLDGAAKGFLTTTSDFAPLLTKDALLGPVIPSRIELVNGKKLLTRLEELAGKR